MRPDDSRDIQAATPPPVEAEILQRTSSVRFRMTSAASYSLTKAADRESGQSWGFSGEGGAAGDVCCDGTADAGTAWDPAAAAAMIFSVAALLILQSRS